MSFTENEPSTPDSRILRRYISLAKFLHLLYSESLFVPYAASFEDELDGVRVSPADIFRAQALERRAKSTGSFSADLAAIHKMDSEGRTLISVSCWCKGESESNLMWKAYCPGHESVAIETTWGKLQAIFTQSPFKWIGGQVSYENAAKHPDPGMYDVKAYFRKREFFKSESEIRVVANPFGEDNSQYVQELVKFDGIRVRVPKLQDFIQRVIINPHAPDWVSETIELALNASGLSQKVLSKSQLRVQRFT